MGAEDDEIIMRPAKGIDDLAHIIRLASRVGEGVER